MAFGRNKKEKKSKKKDKAAGVAQEPELIIGEVQTPKTVGATMLEKGVPTLKDMMAPPSFDRTEFDHLASATVSCAAFCYLVSLSTSCWLADKLYNYDGDLDMTIHINPMDEREAIDELTDKITQYEAQLDVRYRERSNPKYDVWATRSPSWSASVRRSSRTTSPCSRSR